ncbi:MAG TPA: hypothetical protein VLE22_10125 [Bryobacteraceae bacterium]|nr:hypothetical protein [Bryobacteraceae bacterium]
MLKRSVCLVVFALLVAACLPGQEPKPLIVVASFKVHPAKADEWVAGVKKIYVPALEKQFADGAILAYGLDEDFLHSAGKPNFEAWYVVQDYAALEKVDNALDAAASEHKESMGQMMDAVDFDHHSDYVFRTVIGNHKMLPAGAKPYWHFSRVQVQPGKSEEFRKGFEKYVKPTYDELVSSGAICGYDLDVEEVHSMEPGWHWTGICLPNLAAMDKVDAAFDEVIKKRGPEEQAAVMTAYRELVVAGSHRDSVSVSRIFASK